MAYSSFDSNRVNRYTRKSLRLKKHNYVGTATYFVTIRSARFEPLFETPALRSILEKEWNALSKRFSDLELDEFVMMPDHVHFILRLEGNARKPTTLGQVIGADKSLTTVAWLRHIKSLGNEGIELPGIIWHRDYFEHVIQDDAELEQKRQYIRDNPLRWQERHKI